MSNGLLNSGGYNGWDTTPIQKGNNNNNNNNNANNGNVNNDNIDPLFDNNDSINNGNAKLKPYKNPLNNDPNPFFASTNNNNNNEPDNEYINPFIDFTSQSSTTNTSHSNNNIESKNEHKPKQPSMNSIQENQTLDAEVLDLLFDTNTTNNNNNQSNSNNTNDAFYAFDFGINDDGNNNSNNYQSSSKKNIKQIKSQNSTDSYSSDSSDDDEEYSTSDDDDNDNDNNNDNDNKEILKLSPPKQQSKRSKKKRKSLSSTKGEINISENQKAFDKLHNQFDPSLVGTVPITKINKKTKTKSTSKRNTEPVNIHSQRQKQLQKEGLIKLQSPNIGESLRNDNDNDNDKEEKKQKEEKPKKEKEEQKKEKRKTTKYNVLPELHRGTALLKYGRRGYPHFRQFNLTADNENLRWFSTKKKLQQSSINVGSINEILTGQHTKEFRRIAWTTLTPASFSIIYDNKKKSLNLVAKSVDEMKMWVEALRKLRDLKRNDSIKLSKMDKLLVDVDFRDRNRPQSRNHSGNFLRSHETKEREVDPILQRKLIDDIANLRKQFIEISREANNPIVQSTKEYESIEQILSELEERIEELDHEVRNTRNTKIAENDVWRTRIDLESLREKIKVINKQHKSQYKNSKRRWSVF